MDGLDACGNRTRATTRPHSIDSALRRPGRLHIHNAHPPTHAHTHTHAYTGTRHTHSHVLAHKLSMDGFDVRGKPACGLFCHSIFFFDLLIRFDREIEMEPPNVPEREVILRHMTARLPLADDVMLSSLAQRTLGFVGADLNALVKEAFMCALKRLSRYGYSFSPTICFFLYCGLFKHTNLNGVKK